MPGPDGCRAPFSTSQIVLLGLLTALGPLSIDLYLPAFPALQDDLRAEDGQLQFTLAGMTLGLAVGELLTGAWSDRVGRRGPLLVAGSVHVAATVGCALAPTVEALIALRFVQGLGAAGSAVLVLAIVRDVAEGRWLLVLLSRVTLVTTTAPLLAPVLGAELLPVGGWRGIFVVLAAGSAVVLVWTALSVPETRRLSVHAAPLRSRLRAVLADRVFRRASMASAMTYGGVYAYVAASPLLLQQVHDLSPRAYAGVFLLNSLGLVAGVQLSAVLGRRLAPARVLAGFTAVALAAAAAIVPQQAAGAGVMGLLVCLFVFVSACGGCFPCATALALGGQGGQAGTATSLHGFANFTVAGLVSPLAGVVGITDATPLAVVLLGTSLTSLIASGLLSRTRDMGEHSSLQDSPGLPEQTPY